MSTHNDELLLVRLLRLAAPRPAAPPEIESEVRAAVREEWLRKTSRRRRAPWLAAAAIAGLAAGLAVWIGGLRPAATAEPIATVVRASGDVRLDREGDGRGWLPLESTEIGPGSRLATDRASRLAMQLTDGASVRLDHSTELSIESARRLTLESGRIYIDTPAPGVTGGPLRIRTSRGIVSDVGTQFEVAYVEEAVRVRVREGAVTIERDAGRIQGDRGEEVRIGADGKVSRSVVEPFGDHWSWAEAIAPSFDIDGRPLIEFLAWIARETGRDLVFASRASEQAARKTVLHGSVRGFPPHDALVAVLATTGTGLRPATDEGILLIELREPAATE